MIDVVLAELAQSSLVRCVQVATSFAECKLPLNKLHYLSMSGTTTVNGMNDLEHFQQTNSALLTLGVDPSDVNEIWSFVTAMLYLGNITFGDGDTAQVMNTDVMRTAERLLGCESFQELLVRRVITTRGESTYIDHTPQQASLARDSLVKVMYDRLFRCDVRVMASSMSMRVARA